MTSTIILHALQHPYLPLLSRGLLALVFLTSAIGKLRQPHYFIAAVAAYDLLPERLTRPFAYILPWLELTLGLLLLLGWQARRAVVLAACLLLIFILAMGINLGRGRHDVDCGCSGKGHPQKIGWKTITRNAFLLLLCLPVAAWGGGVLALDNQAPSTQTFFVEKLLLNSLLPLALSGIGLYLLLRLLR